MEGKINIWWYGLLEFCIFVPLVYVRKIEKFSIFHIFADFTIFATVVILIVYAGIFIGDERREGTDFKAINTSTFASFIGMAVYSFEGIGIVIPVMEIAKNQNDFPKIVFAVISLLAGLYIFFGFFNYFAY